MCKSTCKNEPACTGFALSDNTFKFPNYCFVYGNISAIMVKHIVDNCLGNVEWPGGQRGGREDGIKEKNEE